MHRRHHDRDREHAGRDAEREGATARDVSPAFDPPWLATLDSVVDPPLGALRVESSARCKVRRELRGRVGI